VGEWELIGDA